MENGLRTLNIAILGPDSMRETATHQEIVTGMYKNEIHIAEIQETHTTPDKRYMVGNYRIITAEAGRVKKQESPQGGGQKS